MCPKLIKQTPPRQRKRLVEYDWMDHDMVYFQMKIQPVVVKTKKNITMIVITFIRG